MAIEQYMYVTTPRKTVTLVIDMYFQTYRCLIVKCNSLFRLLYSMKKYHFIFFHYLFFVLEHRTLLSRNKRTKRALCRSPEEKVKGHSGAIYRGPLMLSTKYGRGPLDDAIYQI